MGLPMVLMEDVLTLLLMMLIKMLAHDVPPPSPPTQTRTQGQERSTKPTTQTLQQLQLEREPFTAMTTTITKWDTIGQQGIGKAIQ